MRHPSRASNGARARAERLAGLFVLAAAILLALLAVGLVLGSFVSYATVKERLDALASDGDAALGPDAFDAIVFRLRLGAALAAGLAVALYAARGRVRRGLAELLRSTYVAARSLVRGLRTAVVRESRLHLGALAGLTLLGLLVRLEFLFQPMRYDESTTYVHYASQPWYIPLTTYTAPNNHVFHSLLVHVSTGVLGGDPWAIRLPALIAGVLLVPATYLAARALYGRDSALLGAGLVAGSSVLVEYSTNARGYTIAAVVFMLLLALASRLQSSSSVAEWVAFALLGAMGLFTVPVMLYGFGTVVVWLAIVLVRSGERGRLTRRLVPATLVTAGSTLLLYAPIAAASGVRSLVDNEFVAALPWRTFLDRLPDSLVATGEGWHRDVPVPLTLLLVGGFVVALVLNRRLRCPWPPVALVALVFSLIVVATQRVVPFERIWLVLLPLYLLTSAAGLVFVARRLSLRDSLLLPLTLGLSAVLAASVLVSGSVRASEDTSTFRAAESVAAFLERELRPGDKLLVAPPADAILEYELMRRGLDPGPLLYWASPGTTTRFLAVVKDTPEDYPLPYLLADPRLGSRLGEGRLLRRYDAASVYELTRASREGPARVVGRPVPRLSSGRRA